MSIVSFYIKAFMGGLLIALFIPYFYITGNKHKASRSLLSSLILKVFGVKPDIIGVADPKTGIFLINHQSVLDIVVMEAITKESNLCWIAKRELFNIPLFGHLFKSCKMIAVDRENKQGLIKLIKDSKEASEQGRPLVIFPEGTRSKGKEMLEFKAGAKLIAEKLSLQVQPIVIVDSASLLDTKHSKGARGGTLKVIYMDPISTEDKEWFGKTRDSMQQTLDNARA